MSLSKIIQRIKLSYIFVILAVFLLTISSMIFIKYIYVENRIIDINLKSDISYIDELTKNFEELLISKVSEKNIYSFLNEHKKVVDELESYLQLFITKKYKYIYVVDKIKSEDDRYRFLLDGTVDIDDKSEFGERYKPFEVQKWQTVYETKKPVYFTHKNLSTLWMTYLRPVIVDGEVKAIIVVDFSMESHRIVADTLKGLDSIYLVAFIFSIIIFIVMIVFSYIDFMREKEKDMALERVKNLNLSLEDRIKKAVEENRQKDQAMFQQSRLAQMGEMINMIAHQWRQPLAAISATSSAINLKAAMKKLDDESAMALSDRISEYSQHLSATIDDFREFFKSNKDKKEVTYEEMIDGVLNIIEVSITNKNIRLIKDLSCNEKFLTYPNELKQVILNLFKNAEDILLERKIENPYIKVATYKKDELLILEISDNGGGVPENIIDKIFDPYFSTKTKKDGTGLGLYMSKTIIEEHCGGELTVINKSEGALFRIAINSNLI